jgi:hypothetical protein
MVKMDLVHITPYFLLVVLVGQLTLMVMGEMVEMEVLVVVVEVVVLVLV